MRYVAQPVHSVSRLLYRDRFLSFLYPSTTALIIRSGVMRFDELRKKFLGRGLLAALFIVAAAAALYGGGVLLKADADPTGVPDSVAKDPLDMLKNARLVPKQRLAITYRDNNWNINNFVFTDKDNDVMTTDRREPNQSQPL